MNIPEEEAKKQRLQQINSGEQHKQGHSQQQRQEELDNRFPNDGNKESLQQGQYSGLYQRLGPFEKYSKSEIDKVPNFENTVQLIGKNVEESVESLGQNANWEIEDIDKIIKEYSNYYNKIKEEIIALEKEIDSNIQDLNNRKLISKNEQRTKSLVKRPKSEKYLSELKERKIIRKEKSQNEKEEQLKSLEEKIKNLELLRLKRIHKSHQDPNQQIQPSFRGLGSDPKSSIFDMSSNKENHSILQIQDSPQGLSVNLPNQSNQKLNIDSDRNEGTKYQDKFIESSFFKRIESRSNRRQNISIPQEQENKKLKVQLVQLPSTHLINEKEQKIYCVGSDLRIDTDEDYSYFNRRYEAIESLMNFYRYIICLKMKGFERIQEKKLDKLELKEKNSDASLLLLENYLETYKTYLKNLSGGDKNNEFINDTIHNYERGENLFIKLLYAKYSKVLQRNEILDCIKEEDNYAESQIIVYKSRLFLIIGEEYGYYILIPLDNKKSKTFKYLHSEYSFNFNRLLKISKEKSEKKYMQIIDAEISLPYFEYNKNIQSVGAKINPYLKKYCKSLLLRVKLKSPIQNNLGEADDGKDIHYDQLLLEEFKQYKKEKECCNLSSFKKYLGINKSITLNGIISFIKSDLKKTNEPLKSFDDFIKNNEDIQNTTEFINTLLLRYYIYRNGFNTFKLNKDSYSYSAIIVDDNLNIWLSWNFSGRIDILNSEDRIVFTGIKLEQLLSHLRNIKKDPRNKVDRIRIANKEDFTFIVKLENCLYLEKSLIDIFNLLKGSDKLKEDRVRIVIDLERSNKIGFILDRGGSDYGIVVVTDCKNSELESVLEPVSLERVLNYIIEEWSKNIGIRSSEFSEKIRICYSDNEEYVNLKEYLKTDSLSKKNTLTEKFYTIRFDKGFVFNQYSGSDCAYEIYNFIFEFLKGTIREIRYHFKDFENLKRINEYESKTLYSYEFFKTFHERLKNVNNITHEQFIAKDKVNILHLSVYNKNQLNEDYEGYLKETRRKIFACNDIKWILLTYNEHTVLLNKVKRNNKLLLVCYNPRKSIHNNIDIDESTYDLLKQLCKNKATLRFPISENNIVFYHDSNYATVGLPVSNDCVVICLLNYIYLNFRENQRFNNKLIEKFNINRNQIVAILAMNIRLLAELIKSKTNKRISLKY
ncbi:MAG: hypothetical protein N4A49_11065 [Marinifilaceae bacterium]|jgi:hypothetical protein|nr:hypothetical protein [Marinifilaceae bacterium]